jgi:hypothetical protein
MSGARNKHGRDQKCILLFGNLKRRDHSEDLGVEGRIILQCILEKQGRKV